MRIPLSKWIKLASYPIYTRMKHKWLVTTLQRGCSAGRTWIYFHHIATGSTSKSSGTLRIRGNAASFDAQWLPDGSGSGFRRLARSGSLLWQVGVPGVWTSATLGGTGGLHGKFRGCEFNIVCNFPVYICAKKWRDWCNTTKVHFDFSAKMSSFWWVQLCFLLVWSLYGCG